MKSTEVNQGRMGDALAPGDDEGRGKLRKFTGSCKRVKIRKCPNGATRYTEGIETKVVNPLN
jgi:hypothetical protein